MSYKKAVNHARKSWRRLSERLLARNRHRLDEASGVLARQLDSWNRKLAERAIPRARRERVDAMARQKGHGRARLSLVSGASPKGDDRLS